MHDQGTIKKPPKHLKWLKGCKRYLSPFGNINCKKELEMSKMYMNLRDA